MFLINVSKTRTWIINEYWLFIPLAILADVYIIKKINKNKQRKKKLKELNKKIEHEKKLIKIILLALGLKPNKNILLRGGSDVLEVVEFIINSDDVRLKCYIEEGIRYLDNQRLRNIVIDLYKNKRKRKIIYITGTAICFLADRYGLKFMSLPFAIGDFGVTSLLQTSRKLFATLCLATVFPLWYANYWYVAFICGTVGLKLIFNNLDYISTSPIDSMKGFEPRIPGMTEVIVINERNKIILPNREKNHPECWLSDQRLLNTKCKVKPTEIPDAIDLVLPDLRYEEIVNMIDVTGLKLIEFDDKIDMGQKEPNIGPSRQGKCRQGKQVNFLEEFGDSGKIPEGEKWDTSENQCIIPEKRYLRTRDKP